MKLLVKIMSIFFIIFLLIICVDGFLAYRSEINSYENNVKNNFIQLGNTLRFEVLQIWQNNNKNKVLDLINGLNSDNQPIYIRLVIIDYLDNRLKSPLPFKYFNGLNQNDSVQFYKEKGEKNFSYLYGYFPIKIDRQIIGILELSQPLLYIKFLEQKTFYRIIIISILLLVFGFLLAWFFGVKLISRPLEKLVERTKRISSGDFRPEELLKSKDELYLLENALNSMCFDLDNFQKKLQTESEKKIQALEELQHAERLATVGKISSGLAHEIGTPLNIIQGRAMMLANEKLESGEMKEYLGIIIEQTRKMTDIIRQFLNYARRDVSRFESTDLVVVIRQTFSLLQPLVKKSQLDFSLHTEQEELSLFIDAVQIQQVLTNLLINAIDAMPEGGIIDVHLSVQEIEKNSETKKYAEIIVADTGTGISAENLDKIFDPFYTTKPKGKGTGLGLSVVKSIIDAHKGWIKVESRPENGTLFYIYLNIGEY